jgi:hypothetical protein
MNYKTRELDKKAKVSIVTASEMLYEEIRKNPFLSSIQQYTP